MIDWHEVARHGPAERIGEIIRRQLNVWVGWVGRAGQVVAVGARQPVEKPLCEGFKGRRDGHGSCQRSLREWVERLHSGALAGEGFQLVRCHGGLSALLVPLRREGDVVGACYASGFVVESTASLDEGRIQARAEALEMPRGVVRQGLRALPRLSEREVRLLGELCQAMVAEAQALLGERASGGAASGVEGGRAEGTARYPSLIGDAPVMRRVYSMIDKVSRSEATVLIQGEAGTGKELVARAIHFNSGRRDEAFIVQNCSAINDNLLDSELFGHRKGAFTGAISDKQGLFELADRGTFFLDEIGDMSAMLQVKLLRVLQEGTFQPVGDTVVRKVDVRIIAATNRDLQEMVREGTFRQDLFYRLNVINLRLPPLRERRGDIPELVAFFMRQHAARHGRGTRQVADETLERLVAYHWPGNVRELENELERLVVLSDDEGAIPPSRLSARLQPEYEERGAELGLQARLPEKLPRALEMVERSMILEGLRRSGWNKTQTARALGISRRNLIRKVDRYDLERHRRDGGGA